MFTLKASRHVPYVGVLAGVEDDRAPGQGVIEQLHVGVVNIRGMRTRDQLTRGPACTCLPTHTLPRARVPADTVLVPIQHIAGVTLDCGHRPSPVLAPVVCQHRVAVQRGDGVLEEILI